MPSAARPHLWGLKETELPRGQMSSFRSKVPGVPSVNPEWHAPPEPTWGRRKAVAETNTITVAMLQERAAALRQQAQELGSAAVSKPSVRIQLGQVLLTMDGKATNEMIQKWDSKGRGEFMKAEMRLSESAGWEWGWGARTKCLCDAPRARTGRFRVQCP